MDPKTLKLFLAGTAAFILVAVGIMWGIKAAQPSGPRIGVDVPMRGM